MGGHKNRAAFVFQLVNEVAHGFGSFGIQAGGRFVQKEHLGFVQERAGNGQFLAHALGEAADGVKAPFPQVQHHQVLIHRGLNVRYVIQSGVDAQVLFC